MKASNVLISSTQFDAAVNCKLSDFGTAKNVQNSYERYAYTNGLGNIFQNKTILISFIGFMLTPFSKKRNFTFHVT